MEIAYQEGDIFPVLASRTSGNLFLPHVCNDKGAWGAGFVVPLARTYPTSRQRYLEWFHGRDGSLPPFAIGRTQFVPIQPSVPGLTICNMVAQTLGGKRPLSYRYLVRCMEQVAERAKPFLGTNEGEIHAPLFGSDLAGGDWNFVEELIKDIWIAEGIPVTIYYLPNRYPSNWTPPALR